MFQVGTFFTNFMDDGKLTFRNVMSAKKVPIGTQLTYALKQLIVDL